jgi:hypothetical protein
MHPAPNDSLHTQQGPGGGFPPPGGGYGGPPPGGGYGGPPPGGGYGGPPPGGGFGGPGYGPGPVGYDPYAPPQEPPPNFNQGYQGPSTGYHQMSSMGSMGEAPGAQEALNIAILSFFCFGFILGPIAISKARTALAMCELNPQLTGRGKAQAAQICGIIALVLHSLGLIVRISAIGGR